MIAFIDVNKRIVKIYDDNGIKNIPFHDIRTLQKIAQNKKIQYITNVIETEASEIVNLVLNLSGEEGQNITPPDIDIHVPEKNYLHSKSKGTLLINDIGIKFEGLSDCKLFDDSMKDNIKKSPIMHSLIKKGTIEIIDEKRKNELITEWKNEMKKAQEKYSARDEALNNILMDEKVEDWNGQIIAPDDAEEAIQIDIGRRGVGRDAGPGSASHGAQTMSELQSMIEGTM